MHMNRMDAPDIRFSVLGGEVNEDDHGEEAEHALEHASYDLEAFRRAVVYGEHPNGDPLESDMPRWNLTDEDLLDLYNYIIELD